MFATLIGCGIWCLFIAVPMVDVAGIFLGFLFLAAAAALFRKSRWARPLTFALATYVIGFFALVTFSGDSLAHLQRISSMDAAISLAPGVAICAVAAYCAVVTMRAVR